MSRGKSGVSVRVGVGVLAIGVLGFAGFVVHDNHVAKSTYVSHYQPVSKTGPTTALIIGDSYAAGKGADPGQGFVDQLTVKTGWVVHVDAEGNTGFIKAGHDIDPTYQPYGDRLAADKAKYAADIVIVTGGRNDAPLPNATTVAAFYLTSVHKDFPKAKLVVVAPFWSDGHPPVGLLAIRDQEKATAKQLGAVFIDPVAEQWITDQDAKQFIGSDGIHPTQAGHDYLATRMYSDLKATRVAP